MTFRAILDTLLVPRENGSRALAEIALWLQQVGEAAGAESTLHEFVCRPYAHRIAGIVVLVLGLGFTVAVLRQRFRWATVFAVLLPACLFLELEYHLPLLSGPFPVTENNVVFSFPAVDATRTLVLGAHYDTKTDLLDHYQRAPVQFIAVPALLAGLATAVSGWRRKRRNMSLRGVQIVASGLGVYYLALFLSLAGGAVVSSRSPGALDDGASVAVLVKLAEALATGSLHLERTDVEIVLFAGEEVGLQGSRAYVRDRGPGLRPSGTYFVNAEALGFGPHLRYFTSDRSSLRRHDASGPLMRLLDRAHRKIARKGITPDPLPVATDAYSFMEAGIPSITLSSTRGRNDAIRGLHSARDSRDRIDESVLDRTLLFYRAVLEAVDSEPGQARP